VTAGAVNLWSDAAHARDYLERRKDIPHRAEGYDALLEFVPPTVGPGLKPAG
jgi:hypothetical protein